MRRYFSFEGRASRLEWWALLVGGGLLGLAIIIPTMLAEISYAQKSGRSDPEEEVSWPDPAFVNYLPVTTAVITLMNVGYFWIFAASSVRRLHDMDRSGWWWWILFVPFIGLLVFTIWLGFYPPRPGANIPNRYG